MQDGARPHIKTSVLDYLRRKGVSRITDWPPYSPHLNPVEQVWAELDRRISEKVPTNEAELKAAALAAWNEIPLTSINKYVQSFKNKCDRCWKSGGEI